MDTNTVLKPEDFSAYYEMAASAGPGKLLLDALQIIEQAGSTQGLLAVDLGAGHGKDTAELLRRRWKVLAIDFSQEGIDILLKRPEAQTYKADLETRVSSFASAVFADATLVTAMLSLPYCPAEEFAAAWQNVVSGLKPGGYFAGHFFGAEQYVGMNHVRRHSKEEIEALLVDFEVLRLEEVNQATGVAENPKYHYFNVIARKRQ